MEMYKPESVFMNYSNDAAADQQLATCATEIKLLTQQTTTAILRIGALLIEARNRVMPGRWGEWLEKEVSYSHATANRFMAVAERFSTREDLVAQLPISKVYALLMAPDDAVEELAEAAQDMSARQFDAEVKRVRQEYDEKLNGVQTAFDALAAEKAEADGQLAQQKQEVTRMQAVLDKRRKELAAAEEKRKQAEQEAKEARAALENAQADREIVTVVEDKVILPPDYADLKVESEKRKAEAEAARVEAEKAKADMALIQQKIEALKKRMELPAAPAGVRAISVEDFAGMVSAMCTGAAALPYMGKRFKAMPEAMRSPYRAPLEQLQVFVTAAMAAIDGVELEVQDA